MKKASKQRERTPCSYPGCGLTFSTNGHMVRHLRIHTGERTHVCPILECQRTFARKDNMVHHFRSHQRRLRGFEISYKPGVDIPKETTSKPLNVYSDKSSMSPESGIPNFQVKDIATHSRTYSSESVDPFQSESPESFRATISTANVDFHSQDRFDWLNQYNNQYKLTSTTAEFSSSLPNLDYRNDIIDNSCESEFQYGSAGALPITSLERQSLSYSADNISAFEYGVSSFGGFQSNIANISTQLPCTASSYHDNAHFPMSNHKEFMDYLPLSKSCEDNLNDPTYTHMNFNIPSPYFKVDTESEDRRERGYVYWNQ